MIVIKNWLIVTRYPFLKWKQIFPVYLDFFFPLSLKRFVTNLTTCVTRRVSNKKARHYSLCFYHCSIKVQNCIKDNGTHVKMSYKLLASMNYSDPNKKIHLAYFLSGKHYGKYILLSSITFMCTVDISMQINTLACN